MESQRSNKISPNLKAQLADAGYYLPTDGWVSRGKGLSSIVPIENAETVQVSDQGFNGYSIRIPKKGELTFDVVMAQIAKKESTISGFVNLTKYMTAMLKNSAISAYPASYGIGVSNIYNPMKKTEVEQVNKILNDLGLDYTNEYSDAGWVYRYKISKSKKNIDILNNI